MCVPSGSWTTSTVDLSPAGDRSLVSVVVCGATGELAFVDDLTAWAIVSFTIAGAVHFFFGWTLLNTSQHRIGAGEGLLGRALWGIAIAAVSTASCGAEAWMGSW